MGRAMGWGCRLGRRRRHRSRRRGWGWRGLWVGGWGGVGAGDGEGGGYGWVDGAAWAPCVRAHSRKPDGGFWTLERSAFWREAMDCQPARARRLAPVRSAFSRSASVIFAFCRLALRRL